jgi:hypothetical protein
VQPPCSAREIDAHVAALLHRHELVAAARDPFHGPPETQCQDGRNGVLAIDVVLDAEGSAHVGRDHADAVFGQPEQARQRRAQPKWRLGRHPHGEAIAHRLGRDQDAARLDGRAGQARLKIETDTTWAAASKAAGASPPR